MIRGADYSNAPYEPINHFSSRLYGKLDVALKKPSESWTELITSIQHLLNIYGHPSRSTSAALSIRSLSGYSDVRLVDYLPGRSGIPSASAEVRASGTKVRNEDGGEGKLHTVKIVMMVAQTD